MVSNALEDERKGNPDDLLKNRSPSTPVVTDKDHEVLILPVLATPVSGLSSGSPSAFDAQNLLVWFSGHGSVFLKVVLDDLGGFFQS